MMVEIPVTVLVVLFVCFLVIWAFYISDLREQIKQLQWESNFWHESYYEYLSKYVDAHEKLRKLKEKED